MERADESQRREFERISVGGIAVDWNIRVTRRPWSSRPKVTSQEAMILDLSLGGASLLIPADPATKPGRRVMIAIGDSAGIVNVRWTHPSAWASLMTCGVSFDEMSISLSERLAQPVTAGAEPDVESWWTAEGWRRIDREGRPDSAVGV